MRIEYLMTVGKFKMKKQNVRIGIEYPDGYEFVRYGRPLPDELVLSYGLIFKAKDVLHRDSLQNGPRFIFKRTTAKEVKS